MQNLTTPPNHSPTTVEGLILVHQKPLQSGIDTTSGTLWQLTFVQLSVHVSGGTTVGPDYIAQSCQVGWAHDSPPKALFVFPKIRAMRIDVITLSHHLCHSMIGRSLLFCSLTVLPSLLSFYILCVANIACIVCYMQKVECMYLSILWRDFNFITNTFRKDLSPQQLIECVSFGLMGSHSTSEHYWKTAWSLLEKLSM